MTKFLIITETPKLVNPDVDRLIITPHEFIQNFKFTNTKNKRPRIVNLCKGYEYLSKGYYVSLLAEARGFKCVPSVADIVRLNWRRNYEFALPEINALVKKYFNEPGVEPLRRTYTSYFGRHEDPKIEPIARKLFDFFRFPIISFQMEYKKSNSWEVIKVESESVTSLHESRAVFFKNTIDQFTGSAWKEKSITKKHEKYWIAILNDPNDPLTPSDKGALKKFIKVGKQMGLWVELITKNEFSSILEFDAIFIRETTSINNHTYKFASKAELEDIPCIDDTQSIIRCCNKVYLNELMKSHDIPVPKTLILDRHSLSGDLSTIEFPVVLKIPDGSFSLGVFKVNNINELKTKTLEILKKSDLVLCQEFLESEFDWRIGVLDNKPLFAIKYYMAEGHWQIYNHVAKRKKNRTGNHETLPVEKVPKAVLELAVKAASKIGNGLYGVDLKQVSENKVVVIEVNDNPNIDEGIEDEVLGDQLYRRILEHFVRLIES